MFSRKYPAPAQLSDEGLQKTPENMERRRRRRDKLLIALLCASFAASLHTAAKEGVEIRKLLTFKNLPGD